MKTWAIYGAVVMFILVPYIHIYLEIYIYISFIFVCLGHMWYFFYFCLFRAYVAYVVYESSQAGV